MHHPPCLLTLVTVPDAWHEGLSPAYMSAIDLTRYCINGFVPCHAHARGQLYSATLPWSSVARFEANEEEIFALVLRFLHLHKARSHATVNNHSENDNADGKQSFFVRA